MLVHEQVKLHAGDIQRKCFHLLCDQALTWHLCWSPQPVRRDGECDIHLCPVEVAEAAITEVNIGWITDNMYLRPLLLGQVEPTRMQCFCVMGSGVLPNMKIYVSPEFRVFRASAEAQDLDFTSQKQC